MDYKGENQTLAAKVQIATELFKFPKNVEMDAKNFKRFELFHAILIYWFCCFVTRHTGHSIWTIVECLSAFGHGVGRYQNYGEVAVDNFDWWFPIVARQDLVSFLFLNAYLFRVLWGLSKCLDKCNCYFFLNLVTTDYDYFEIVFLLVTREKESVVSLEKKLLHLFFPLVE